MVYRSDKRPFYCEVYFDDDSYVGWLNCAFHWTAEMALKWSDGVRHRPWRIVVDQTFVWLQGQGR